MRKRIINRQWTVRSEAVAHARDAKGASKGRVFRTIPPTDAVALGYAGKSDGREGGCSAGHHFSSVRLHGASLRRPPRRGSVVECLARVRARSLGIAATVIETRGGFP
jgi:hypothetical protein